MGNLGQLRPHPLHPPHARSHLDAHSNLNFRASSTQQHSLPSVPHPHSHAYQPTHLRPHPDPGRPHPHSSPYTLLVAHRSCHTFVHATAHPNPRRPHSHNPA